MPQIKINNNDPNAPRVYGTSTNNNRETFRERLMRRFAAHEYVRVINIDDEPVMWQYMPEHGETIEFTADPMKITYRTEPELWQLEAGQDEVLVGANAYLMIDVLYKKLVSKKVINRTPNIAPGQARNFNWTDGTAQEDLIDRIYLGKEKPEFIFEPVTPKADARGSLADQVAKDLGLDDGQADLATTAGRTRKAV